MSVWPKYQIVMGERPFGPFILVAEFDTRLAAKKRVKYLRSRQRHGTYYFYEIKRRWNENQKGGSGNLESAMQSYQTGTI